MLALHLIHSPVLDKLALCTFDSYLYCGHAKTYLMVVLIITITKVIRGHLLSKQVLCVFTSLLRDIQTRNRRKTPIV